VSDIRWVASTPSTNTALRSEPIGSALATLNQTAGRGRLGREWLESPGKGLAISVVVHPTDIPTLVPLVAGAALVTVLNGHGINAWMKWPNDVYIGERKVAGVLTEMQEPGRIIVGLGVNVRHAQGEVPLETATSLAAEGFDIDATEIADAWLATVRARLAEVGTPALVDWVRSVSPLIGERVAIDMPDGTHREVDIRNIAPDGSLELTTGETIVAGEITRLRRAD
jgi:BirA family biotin operon repressor/biotin-[acetyl-CoA-carboxylase] ligase